MFSSSTSISPKPLLVSLSLIAGGTFSSLAVAEENPLLNSFYDEAEPVLDQYCYDCHGYGSEKGGVALDGFADDFELRDHNLWLRALTNIRTGLMPPNDEDQPSEEEREELVQWIKRKAFQLDPQNPDPGRVTLRRLNRVEYRNTIKDLLGYDYDTSLEFPADDTGHGFDNMGDVLTISPMLLEKYLDAAQQIISETVPQMPLVVARSGFANHEFSISGEGRFDKSGWKRELSYYDPVQVSVLKQIEVPGDYRVVMELTTAETYVNDQFDLNECLFTFKVDGDVVEQREFAREGWKSFEFSTDREWKEGAHEISIEIEPLTPDREQIRDLRLVVTDLRVEGPFAREHWVRPENYEQFFPEAIPQSEDARKAYAERLLSDFTTKAFRRPVDRRTVERLTEMAMYSASQDGATFESGIAQAMVAVLASPRFLFREEGVVESDEDKPYALVDEYALASRLSYFLWSTMPDETLFELASKKQLRANLASQIDRMLQHPKSNEFISNFVGQWLQARDIEGKQISSFEVWLRENPDPSLAEARAVFRKLRQIPEEERSEEDKAALEEARSAFFATFRIPKPELGREVRSAMREETELFFEYILRNDRSVVELINGDYTFLNEKLAKHYEIEGVEGDEMRLVSLPKDSPRGGVLTQGTVLAVTSNPSRTSPVKRGVFILDNILGTPPPPPPPNVTSLEDVATEEELAEMSLRETLALHAGKAACRACHNRMDPLGLALENFNAMGRWRDSEMSLPIEPEGTLITGESFTNIRELKDIIANERREDFYHCLSEKLLTYALGRGLEYYDVATLDHLVETLEETNGSPQALIRGIIESAPFQKRRNIESSETQQLAVDKDKGSELANANN